MAWVFFVSHVHVEREKVWKSGRLRQEHPNELMFISLWTNAGFGKSTLSGLFFANKDASGGLPLPLVWWGA